jgi:hypothetical protein
MILLFRPGTLTQDLLHEGRMISNFLPLVIPIQTRYLFDRDLYSESIPNLEFHIRHTHNYQRSLKQPQKLCPMFSYVTHHYFQHQHLSKTHM